MSELKITVSALHSASQTVRPSPGEKTRSESVSEDISPLPMVYESDESSLCTAALGKPRLSRDYLRWRRTLVGPVEYSKAVKLRLEDTKRASKLDTEEEADEVQVILRLPAWLLPCRYHFRARRAYSGWEYSLRTSAILPSTSPVFQLSLDGDVDGLRRLFDTRTASPFDVDIDGYTPLHVSLAPFNPFRYKAKLIVSVCRSAITL
jgi:hypothetical protein